MPTYEESIAFIKQNQENSGKPGYNMYGVPLFACYGYRHDAHYWAWMHQLPADYFTEKARKLRNKDSH